MAISDKLTTLNGIKSDIKAAIIAKGGTATDDMTTYAAAITNLPSGGGGSEDLKNLIERDITSINIPAGTTTIGNNAFQNCTRLTSVTIPNSVTYIGKNAFFGCTGLTSVTIPDLVTKIDTNAFQNCTSLTSVTIGDSVKTIDTDAFYNCSGLTSVTIPDSVTTIGSSAFNNCTHLTSVTIGNSVASISNYVLQGCSSLTSITSLNTTPPTIQKNTFANVPSTCPIYVPAESVEAYKAKQYWSARAAYIQAIPSANTLEFDNTGYSISDDLNDQTGETNNCGPVEVLYNGTAVNPSSLTVTCSPNYAVFNQVTVNIYDEETGEPTGETDSFYTFSTNQSTVGTYTCTASVTYQGLTATATVNIDITDSSQEQEQPVPEGLHEFTISQSNWPDCAMMVEAEYNPDDVVDMGVPGSQTVNIYTDPSGEPVNSITYNCFANEYNVPEMNVENTNYDAGVYCTQSSEWHPYESDPQAFKLECRTAGTYYIEVVDHTDPKFYDANGNQIYPDNA